MDFIRKTMAAVKLYSAKPNSTWEEDKENCVYAISERITKKNYKHYMRTGVCVVSTRPQNVL